MKSLGSASLGANTFCASRHKNEECGINGLPLTPNSIRILGCFQKLATLSHTHLSLYLDLVRGKHERVFVVFEHYERDLSMHRKMKLTVDRIIKLTHDILNGLTYLNRKGFIHGFLAPKNIYLDNQERAILSNYGLFHMTEGGVTVSFPIGSPKYMAPEIYCSGAERFSNEGNEKRKKILENNCLEEFGNRKWDVWSLGIILLELVCAQDLWSNLGLEETIKKNLSFVVHKDVHPLDVMLEDLHALQHFQQLPLDLQSFIRKCLNLMPSQRPTPIDLIEDELFKVRGHLPPPLMEEQHRMLPAQLRSNDLPDFFQDECRSNSDDLLSERSMEEVYYLWKLAGGDVEGTFKKLGRLSSRPPIMSLPCFVSADGETYGSAPDSSMLFDDAVVVLPQSQLRQRLKDLDERSYYPLLEFNNFSDVEVTSETSSCKSGYDFKEMEKLPLVIRENDVEYQFHRIILFKRLIEAYPFQKQQIIKECRTDIPPLYRAQLWAAILEVEGDIVKKYQAIDKESPSPTDRQIEVDIPRCHQYNPLLSSPVGHHKFKRLLKAWVASHPEYVYWQGLDSLCAPFLYLNFNDEAMAFACLTAFIPKYLHNFFLKDNAPVIQEYLAVFSHLIAFQDPVLFSHLDSIGFIPDLYSIPWFLTMYAHVFPLHKIFHLWDTLLLGNPSFPLCVGVAILKQLRDQLLTFGFNECILLFSDMPEIDMERCVQESIQIFRSTPKSITFRHHAGKTPNQKLAPRPPVASFFMKDYHEAPKTHLSIDQIPLEDLRSEKCPRISAEDLIKLMDLHCSVSLISPTRKNKSDGKAVIVVLDVRPVDEFRKGSIPGSINIPYSEAVTQEGELTSAEAIEFLVLHKNSIKVVLGNSSGKKDLWIAERLIRLGYTKVCILHKGIDILKTEGLLTASSLENI